MRSNPRRLDAVLVAAMAAVLVAAVGATLTDLGPWYQNLTQPSWKIPDPAFGVIWTVIFSLCALSAADSWRNTRSLTRRQTLVGLFAFNGFLNVVWSLLFFKLQRPDLALYEVAVLWLSIAVLIAYMWPTAKRASLMLLPYLAWVSTAALLNYQVVQLNGPFG